MSAQTNGATLSVMPLADLLAGVEEFRKSEPFYAWMTESGFCPDDGWLLVLPSSMGLKVDGKWHLAPSSDAVVRIEGALPKYVRISPVITSPMFVQDLFKDALKF